MLQAVLGLNCPEIHVCGGMEGAVLVEALAKEVRRLTFSYVTLRYVTLRYVTLRYVMLCFTPCCLSFRYVNYVTLRYVALCEVKLHHFT